MHEHERMLHRFWATVERNESVDHFLAPEFEMVGALINTDTGLQSNSVDARLGELDEELESWTLWLHYVVNEPGGERLAAIVEVGASKEGETTARLSGLVYEFAESRILRATVYRDSADALLEIGVDPVTAFVESRDDPEVVVWNSYERISRHQSVDDLWAQDARLEGNILPTSREHPSQGIAERKSDLSAIYDERSINLVDTFTGPDGRVVATLFVRGTHDSEEGASTGAVVFEVRDGLIQHAVAFQDLHDAVEAVRTPEMPVSSFQDLFDIAGVGLIHNAADGSIIEANQSASVILGLTRDQLLGRAPADPGWRAVHEDGSPYPGEEHPVSITLRTGVNQTGVIMGVHKPDGTLVWISVTTRLLPPKREGAAPEILASFTDITNLKQASDQARHALEVELLRDPLTGLPNRMLLMDRLGQALSQAQRMDNGVAVLFMDLDHFKEINDKKGHEAGDRTLIAVGRLATSALRSGDTVARLSGDEFAVLCVDCTIARAQEVATRILAFIAPAHAGPDTPPVAASIGISHSDDGNISPADLLAHADRAMYVAKQSGGGQCEVFSGITE